MYFLHRVRRLCGRRRLRGRCRAYENPRAGEVAASLRPSRGSSTRSCSSMRVSTGGNPHKPGDGLPSTVRGSKRESNPPAGRPANC